MLTTLALSALAIAAPAAAGWQDAFQSQEPDVYTSTSAVDVYAAQATAKTESPTSNVSGKAFDRIAIIWNENTDYTKAKADREYILYFAFPNPSFPHGTGVVKRSRRPHLVLPFYAFKTSICGRKFG